MDLDRELRLNCSYAIMGKQIQFKFPRRTISLYSCRFVQIMICNSFWSGTVTESSLIINSTIMLLAAIDSIYSLLLLQFLGMTDGQTVVLLNGAYLKPTCFSSIPSIHKHISYDRYCSCVSIFGKNDKNSERVSHSSVRKVS